MDPRDVARSTVHAITVLVNGLVCLSTHEARQRQEVDAPSTPTRSSAMRCLTTGSSDCQGLESLNERYGGSHEARVVHRELPQTSSRLSVIRDVLASPPPPLVASTAEAAAATPESNWGRRMLTQRSTTTKAPLSPITPRQQLLKQGLTVAEQNRQARMPLFVAPTMSAVSTSLSSSSTSSSKVSPTKSSNNVNHRPERHIRRDKSLVDAVLEREHKSRPIAQTSEITIPLVHSTSSPSSSSSCSESLTTMTTPPRPPPTTTTTTQEQSVCQCCADTVDADFDTDTTGTVPPSAVSVDHVDSEYDGATGQAGTDPNQRTKRFRRQSQSRTTRLDHASRSSPSRSERRLRSKDGKRSSPAGDHDVCSCVEEQADVETDVEADRDADTDSDWSQSNSQSSKRELGGEAILKARTKEGIDWRKTSGRGASRSGLDPSSSSIARDPDLNRRRRTIPPIAPKRARVRRWTANGYDTRDPQSRLQIVRPENYRIGTSDDEDQARFKEDAAVPTRITVIEHLPVIGDSEIEVFERGRQDHARDRDQSQAQPRPALVVPVPTSSAMPVRPDHEHHQFHKENEWQDVNDHGASPVESTVPVPVTMERSPIVGAYTKLLVAQRDRLIRQLNELRLSVDDHRIRPE